MCNEISEKCDNCIFAVVSKITNADTGKEYSEHLCCSETSGNYMNIMLAEDWCHDYEEDKLSKTYTLQTIVYKGD